MSKGNKIKYKQVVKILPFQPLQCIQNEDNFLNPSTPQQMWDNIHLLMNFYSRGGSLSKNFTQKILNMAIALIKNEPNLLYLSDPIHIVGDIHGQFYDLVEHLQKMNIYSLVVHNNRNSHSKRRKVLFLGDYVDRGNFSVQVTILVLVLKIYLPKTFYLLRGNHECREVTQIYNFKRECLSKYGQQETYDLFIDLFWTLPLAAVVNRTYFCVHGGLSEDLKFISDIEKIHRFREIPRKGLMCDMLWSDPVDDKQGKIKQDKNSEFNKMRNCSIKFGEKMIRQFFRENDVMCMIRAHEVQESGYDFINWGEQYKFPDIMTIFSAPNYCGGRNKGAIAYIEKNEIEIFVIEKKIEPFVFPNFINGFEASIPYMAAYLTELFFRLLSTDAIIDREEQNESVKILQKIKSKGEPQKIDDKILQKEEYIAEQTLIEKQEYLLGVYSMVKRYMKNNISFESRLKGRRNRAIEARQARDLS